jgi:hypothetical protein
MAAAARGGILSRLGIDFPFVSLHEAQCDILWQAANVSNSPANLFIF